MGIIFFPFKSACAEIHQLSLSNNSELDGCGLSVCCNPDCRCRFLPESWRLPFSGLLPLNVSSQAVRDILRSGRYSDSQDSNIPIDHGHLARNCSIKINDGYVCTFRVTLVALYWWVVLKLVLRHGQEHLAPPNLLCGPKCPATGTGSDRQSGCSSSHIDHHLNHGCANHATEGKCFCPPSAAVT